MRRLCVYRLLLPYSHSFPYFPSARPCQRCVKKGSGGECAEGHRKKAKYLMDDSEKGASTRLLRKLFYLLTHLASFAIATLAGYSSTRKPLAINRTSNGKTNSPRIGDIGTISLPKPEIAVEQGHLQRRSLDNGQAGNAPDDGVAYYAAADGMAGPGTSRNVEEGQFDRDVWQETDTMYDNLPFDPAYRRFPALSRRVVSLTRPHSSSVFTPRSIRIGSRKP